MIPGQRISAPRRENLWTLGCDPRIANKVCRAGGAKAAETYDGPLVAMRSSLHIHAVDMEGSEAGSPRHLISDRCPVACKRRLVVTQPRWARPLARDLGSI